jgi:cell division protease FtsH
VSNRPTGSLSHYDRRVAKRKFRHELAQLVRELLNESAHQEHSLAAAIAAHLGDGVEALPVYGEVLPSYEHPNVQLALEARLGEPGWDATVLGVAGQGRRFSDLSLADLVSVQHFGIGAPEYVNEAVGPGRTLPCLVWAVLLVSSPSGPLVVFVRRGDENGPAPGIAVQVLARDADLAQALLADLRRLMEELDVFRGQVITIEIDRRGGRSVVFVERPVMDERELVLPDGVLRRIEQHMVGPSRHREALRARQRHLSRGLLLWGPPGTGKTHTVRYLTSRLTDATVIILSGGSLGMVGAFGPLARRLEPAVVVLEDVDLVAQERSFGPFGSSPALFELMNEMSGLGADADVAFVLTTNRPDALEPALAARPGRVDLAIEITLPDERARRALLELYAEGLEIDGAAIDDVVARTAGVTASFFKELLRKAALAAIEGGRERVEAADLQTSLDELLDETAALTRVLLGSGEPGSAAPNPHEWLEGLPGATGSSVHIQRLQ